MFHDVCHFQKGDAEEDEKEDQLKSSPDADSVILFVKNNEQRKHYWLKEFDYIGVPIANVKY